MSAFTDAMFSSERGDWATPVRFFQWVSMEFKFDTDVCASPHNAKCEQYFTKEQDGLAQEWTGTCWMNPPYGDEIAAWVKKAYESSLAGATVVCLLPSRTDTAWWHRWCMKGEIRFIRGRLNFDDGKNPAPFPSVLVIFRPPAHKIRTLTSKPFDFGEVAAR